MDGRRSRGLTLFLLLIFLSSLGAVPPVYAADPLLMGVFPRRNAKITTTLFTPMADYLARQLGRPVKLASARDFESFWVGVEQQRYDLVHFNQYHSIQARRYGYQVIASNEEFGRTSLAGALYVRKDSGIKTVSELRGKRIVFGGGPTAMMSYIVPRFLLQQAGLNPGDYTEEFAISPPNAVFATYYGAADAGGAGDIVKELPLVTAKIDTDQLTLLATSKQLPHLPWAVVQSMEPTLRGRLIELLTGLKGNEAGRRVLKAAKMTAMHPANDSDYQAHEEIIDRVFAAPSARGEVDD